MNQFSHSASFQEFERVNPMEEVDGSARSRLRALRGHYTYLLNNLPGVVYRCQATPPWHMQFISSKVLGLTGRHREEFESGLGWAEIVHPEDLEGIAKAVQDAVECGQQFSINYRIIHASGAVIWVREQGQSATPDPNGELILEGFIQDVTQEHELARSLRLAEAQSSEWSRTLDAVLESATDCVFSVDEEWLLTYVNGKARKHFGGGGEMIGQEIWTLFTDGQPSEFRDCLRRAMLTREPASAEGFMESRQNWYELHAAPTLGGITVFFRDITARRQLDEIEKAAADRWRATLDMIPQMVWSMAGGDRQPDFYNNRWFEFTGLPPGSLGGAEWTNLFHPEDREPTLEKWRASRSTGAPYEAEYRMRSKDGDYRWVVSRGQAEIDAHGKVVRWYGTCTDMHERYLDRAAVRDSEALNRGIIEASPDCISLLDEEGAILYANGATLAASELLTAEPLIGTLWGSSFEPYVQAKAVAALKEAKAGGVGRLVLRGGPQQSRWYDVAVAPLLGSGVAPKNFIVISRDFSERKAAEEKAHWTAHHDVLTRLPNRFLFNQHLERGLANVEAGGIGFALLLFDVDHLKHVNDAMGHDAGDALLREAATRLSRVVAGMGGNVFRLGGDEFAVLLPGVTTKEEVQRAAGKLREQLTVPFIFAGKLVDCHASTGASICPLHGRGKDELLKSADIALYAAKKSSKGHLRVFEPAMRDQMQRRLAMLSLAKGALERNQIVPYYQPKTDLEVGNVAGFEALLRWKDSTGRLQLPSLIAAAFDNVDLASDISDRMTELVLDDVVSWTRMGVSFGHVALNAGAVELRRPDFVDVLLARLQERKVSPHKIQLEVTETVFLGPGSEHIHGALMRLSKAGIRIALDDFGTGYASLSHLNNHPVDLIKIDRSFIQSIGKCSTGAPIVDAIISLGQSLGIRVVAEGIENEAQHAFLVKRGCEFAQGFFYGAAVPSDAVPALVASFRTDAGRIGKV